MDQRTPPEVLEFTVAQEPAGEPIDRLGQDLVALLQEAAKASNEKVERAVSMAHKLSIQLRSAEDRIAQLDGHAAQLRRELEHLQSRAGRAEGWLERIKQEVEDKLLALEANRPELPVVH
jgi:chromosome segregation ATPase